MTLIEKLGWIGMTEPLEYKRKIINDRNHSSRILVRDVIPDDVKEERKGGGRLDTIGLVLEGSDILVLCGTA
jgi:hypothetical protein